MANNDTIETIETETLVTATGGKAPMRGCFPVAPWGGPARPWAAPYRPWGGPWGGGWGGAPFRPYAPWRPTGGWGQWFRGFRR